MRLQFDKSGRRFFFTFCVGGRKEVLSYIVKKVNRVGKPGYAVELIPKIERMVEKARRGMLPVCGSLSPGEKELERRLRQEPFARWIKTMAHGLPQRSDPTVEDSRFLADGRQLILSSFPADVPVFPVNYDNCHLMNARNEALCRRAIGEEKG